MNVKGIVEVSCICIDYNYVVFFINKGWYWECVFVGMFEYYIDIVVFVGDVLDCFVEFVCFFELFGIFWCVYGW